MKRNSIVLLSLALAVSVTSVGEGQSPLDASRRTPLGTQRPMPSAATMPGSAPPRRPASPPPASPVPASPREAPAAVVQGARIVHGSSDVVSDSIAEGHITYFRGTGRETRQVTFEMTLLRKGETQVQRTVQQSAGEVRQGSDGSRTWNSFKGDAQPAAGASLRFIESQTSRSLHNLLGHDREGRVLRDVGVEGNARVLEVEDRAGRKSRYSVDSASSVVTRMDFEVGHARDMLSGKLAPVLESYLFSDFRVVQGLLTPFKIERYIQGRKLEEMQFATVRYNSAVPDSAFRP